MEENRGGERRRETRRDEERRGEKRREEERRGEKINEVYILHVRTREKHASLHPDKWKYNSRHVLLTETSGYYL